MLMRTWLGKAWDEDVVSWATVCELFCGAWMGLDGETGALKWWSRRGKGLKAHSKLTFPLVLYFFSGCQCPMQEMKPQTNVSDLLPKLKAMALADRAVFEKGMKAFVSYVQAYAKHECNLIFRIKGNSRQQLVSFTVIFQKTVFSLVKKTWCDCLQALTIDSSSQIYFLQHQILTKLLSFPMNLFLIVFKRKYLTSELTKLT